MIFLHNKRWIRYSLLVVLVFGAQPAVQAQDRPGWFTRAWQSDVGLPDNTVVGIDLATDGFLWVATPAGLVRFDGLRFQPFAAATAAGGAANLIQTMRVDRRGRLWLAKERGTLVCVEQGTTKVLTVAEGLPNLMPETMAVDSADGLWLSYIGGKVVRIQEGRMRAFSEADGLPGGGTCQLTSDADGHVWFSQGGWVGVYRDGRFRPLAEVEAQCITAAKAGGIWICTGKELSRYTEGGSLKKVGDLPTALPEVTPTVLHEDRSATFLWIGTKEAGLFRYSGIVVKVTEHQQILSVKSDQQGNVWIGTRGGGLNQLKPKAVELLSPASPIEFMPVRSLCQDMTDTRWIVTQNGMVWRSWGGGWVPLSDDGWTFSDAQCVIAASQSGVWIGTQTHGLHRWQDKALTTSLTPANGLAGDSVSALLAVPSGALWIGVGASDRQHHALQCWQAGQFRTFPLPTTSGPVTALTLDAAGDCWAATFSGLLLRVRGNDLTDETSTTLAEPNAIRCLLVTPDNSLWIGYGGQGLGRLKAGRFSRCRMEQGLYDDYISQILPDSRGRLWFAGNRGIFSVFQSELDELAEGLALRVRSVAYGSNDGLPRLQASHGFWPGALLTTSKHLVFAMESGLADVSAAELFKENKEEPSVVIERVSVNGKAVAAYGVDTSLTAPGAAAPIELWGRTPHVCLSSGQRQLEFAFTALNFTKPEDMGFKYRLHPLDKDWMDAGTRRIAAYQRIPPGDYCFQLIACNSSGVWNKTGASLKIEVLPYFWQTWWFQLLAMMSLLGSVAGIVRYLAFRRMRLLVEKAEREGAVERERGRIARDIHDDLGANLAEIAMLSELAQEDLPVETPARGYLNEIFTRAESNVRTLGEIVWAIKPVNDTLEHFSAYLCKFAQDYLSLAGVRCRLNLPETLPPLPLDSFQRHNMYLTAKEAIHNAVKHGAPTEVVLSIAVDERMVITIEDNGCGCVEPVQESKAGHGSANMRTRMEQIGGTFERRSAAGRGTVVTLTLPLERTQVNS